MWLINVKMPTNVGILTLISMINMASGSLKASFKISCSVELSINFLSICADQSEPSLPTDVINSKILCN